MSESIIQDIGLVERILQKRIDAETGAVEYLIRWQGTDEHGNEYRDTWEPEQNILGEELIEEFDRRLAEKRSLHQHQNHRHRSPSRTNGSRSGYSDPKQDGREGGGGGGGGGGGAGGAGASGSTLFEPTQQQTTTRYSNHSDGPYGLVSTPHPMPSSSGYNVGHLYAYPSMHKNTQQYPWPYPPPPLPPHQYHLGYAHSKRDRSREDFSKPSKRKARSIDNTGLDPNETPLIKAPAGESNQDTEESTTQDGSSIRQHGRRNTYTSSSSSHSTDRRMFSNGTTSTTIRSLKLDLDHEKTFFRSVIEKSTLVKDATVRAELISFLKNPTKSGLPQGASLLKSNTWLIELKEQQGSASSLFLALDIPKGTAKALFIPERMLEYQRQGRPGEGIVVTDRAIVSAIMEGDLQGSGLYPPSSTPTKESLPRESSTATAASSTATDGAIRSENDMEIDGEQPTMNEIRCGWKDCERTFSMMTELSLHVQQEHLQSPLPGSRNEVLSPTQATAMGTLSEMNLTAEVNLTTGEEQDGFAQETYQSLLNQIAQTKETASSIDRHIQDSRALYTSAVSWTKENIKRLEARLEWESKKWAKYQDQTSKMGARGDVLDQREIGLVKNGLDHSESSGNRVESSNSKQNIGGGNPIQDVETLGLDKPMEAQSISSIRKIQRQLANAKVDLTRLEDDNRALYEKRRVLGTELCVLEERHKQTMAQYLTLKNREDATREELQHRTKSIEDCKASMEQDQIESRRLVGQLQTMIGMFSQPSSSSLLPSSSSSPPPPQPPPPQPLSLSLTQSQSPPQHQQQQQPLFRIDNELNAGLEGQIEIQPPLTFPASTPPPPPPPPLAPPPAETAVILAVAPAPEASELVSATTLQPVMAPPSATAMDMSQPAETTTAAAVLAANFIDLLTKNIG